MAVSSGYRSFILEQLGRIAPVTDRSMFGAVGVYAEEHFFAIIDDDRLYFKVDDSNRPDFEEAGMEPFRPYEDQSVAMQYYEVPIEVLEDPDRLRPWVEKSVEVARRAKRPRRRAARAGRG